jgi:hypothetical protein
MRSTTIVAATASTAAMAKSSGSHLHVTRFGLDVRDVAER